MIGSVFRFLGRTGIRRGIFGGSRIWAVVAIASWVIKAIRWLANRDEKVVHSDRLKPGETLVISASGGEKRLLQGHRQRGQSNRH